MNEPSKQEDPQNSGEYELDDRHHPPALYELPQARDEKTAYRSDHVSCRSLTTHDA